MSLRLFYTVASSPATARTNPPMTPTIILERLNSQLGCFLRTVTERPDLAALVRGVTCNAYYASLSTIKTSTHPWKTIAFIVNKLPNLEQYSVDIRGALPFYFRHFQGSNGRPSSDDFEHLFNLLKYHDNGETDQVPSVPILKIRMSHPIHQGIRIEPYTSPKIRIDTLRIVDSRVHRTTLDAILSSCTNLTTFIHRALQKEQEYSFRGAPSYYSQFDQMDASQSLAIHKDTLETLHLDMRHETFVRQPRPGSSLGSFTALQSLLVDSFFVCSKRGDPSTRPERLVEMLPPNLISLELVGCPGKALPVFANMFLALVDAIREGRFRALTRIEYNANNASVLGADTCFDDLAVASKFAELGVAFTYNRPPFDNSELATAGDRAWDFGVIDLIELSRVCYHESFPGSSAMPLPDEDEDSDL